MKRAVSAHTLNLLVLFDLLWYVVYYGMSEIQESCCKKSAEIIDLCNYVNAQCTQKSENELMRYIAGLDAAQRKYTL